MTPSIGRHTDMPAPRHPGYLRQERTDRIDDLLPLARHIVHKRYGYPSLGTVVPGDDILIATYPHQDELVLEAIKRAFIEEGASSVNVIHLTDLGIEERKYSAADGWREVPDALIPMVEQGVDYNEQATALKRYLDDRPGYSSVYVGEAAAIHWQRTVTKRVRNTWIFTTYESLISKGNGFPDALWDMIDRKVVETFARAAEVHITDPQGTDIGWKVSERQAELWAKGSLIPGHILGSTIQGVRFNNPLEMFLQEAKELFPTLNGVVAGTGNHTGFFPHIEVNIEGGMIRSIVGGGKYGELWRDVVSDYAHAKYPGFPYDGWAYFNDCSIGTNPSSHRNIEGLWDYNDPHTNLPERLRAGVIHFGFGAEHWGDEFLKYARANKFPTFHFPHVHNYFPTWRMKDRETGEWFNLIEDGWLTVLDDPAVKRTAQALVGAGGLEYDWIPAIPGINYAGSYDKDFAPDPASFIAKEQSGELNIESR